jgi:hypothetical protein
MKKLLLCLVLGVSAGYVWGFGEGRDRMPNVAVRVLNKFGVAKMKAAGEARQARTDEASRP